MPESFDDMLAHFGIPGMKWGVRRAQNHKYGKAELAIDRKIAKAGKAHREKKAEKADKKWEKDALSSKTMFDIYNKAAQKANQDLGAINAKWAGKDLIGDPVAKLKYDTEVVKNFNKHVREATAALPGGGKNPSGTKQLAVVINPISGQFYATATEIKHADGVTGVKLIVTRDDNGFITNIAFPSVDKDGITHQIDSFDDMLAHFGVRGMRWGVRKKSGSKSEEAVDPAKKKVNPKNLSDEELRKAVNRLQMERQYRELTRTAPSKLNVGKKFAAEVVRQVAKETVVSVAKSHTTKAVAGFMAVDPKTAAATIAKAKATVAKATT